MLTKYHLYADMINATGTPGAGLVVDTTCTRPGVPAPGPSHHVRDCLSALIDTSGGSDDGFVQSPVNSVVQAWVYYGTTQVARLAHWLGEHSEAERLEARAAAMQAAFNRWVMPRLIPTPVHT